MKLHLYNKGLVCDMQVMHYTSPVKYKCVDKTGQVVYYPISYLEEFMAEGNYEIKSEVEMNDI